MSAAKQISIGIAHYITIIKHEQHVITIISWEPSQVSLGIYIKCSSTNCVQCCYQAGAQGPGCPASVMITCSAFERLVAHQSAARPRRTPFSRKRPEGPVDGDYRRKTTYPRVNYGKLTYRCGKLMVPLGKQPTYDLQRVGSPIFSAFSFARGIFQSTTSEVIKHG